MAYKFAYQMMFTNVEQTDITVNIYDTLSGDGTTTFEEIEAADDPLHLMVVDADENKFTPIKAKEAEISFVSSSTVNLTTFIGSEDNRWHVEILFGSQVKFKGFLLTEEITEDFLDSDTSNIVELVATDNIGLLKDTPLKMLPIGINPRGYFRIIDYIAWCVKSTGLDLNINIVHNVHEEHTAGKIIFESCFLQSKSFEADINESEDCYTVLEKILGNYCFLTQYNGEWWIISVDDLQDNETIVHHFDTNGVWLSKEEFGPVQVFAPDSSMEFSGMSTFVKAQGAVRNTKITYSYQYPEEIIDNIDFARGSLVQDLGNTKEYALDDWTLKVNSFGTQLTPTAEGRAFITRKFEDDYEKERYAVIQNPGAGNNKAYFLSAAKVPVHVKDKFDLSIDSRYNADVSGSGFYRHSTMHVILRAENGNVWTLHGGTSIEPDPIWQLGSNFVYIVTEGRLESDNLTEWKTVYKTNPYPPFPSDGELEISLVYNNTLGNEKYFSNLRFTYIPYINGSYAEYNGQYHSVTQNISTKKVVDDSVSISDSPKRLFKGALHYHDNIRFRLANRFYDGRQYPTAAPGDLTLRKPYGAMQVFSVWNQNNRPFRIFDFQSQGLTSEPDIVHKYTIAEATNHTINKYFMLLHFDQDVKLCEWKGVMAEVWDTAEPKDYSSTYEFKYISDK